MPVRGGEAALTAERETTGSVLVDRDGPGNRDGIADLPGRRCIPGIGAHLARPSFGELEGTTPDRYEEMHERRREACS
jgi:hypothetical protein